MVASIRVHNHARRSWYWSSRYQLQAAGGASYTSAGASHTTSCRLRGEGQRYLIVFAAARAGCALRSRMTPCHPHRKQRYRLQGLIRLRTRSPNRRRIRRAVPPHPGHAWADPI